MSIAHKLKNALTPIYSLANMVIDLEKNPELLPLVIENAKLALDYKSKIDEALIELNELED